MKSFLLLALCALATATVHFKETFDEGWESRWVKSANKEAEGAQGDWAWTAGKYNLNPEDKGIQTTPDARFYQISAAFPEFSNEGKDLYVQFSVKHEQKIDCGGGYIKLMPKIDQTNFGGDSPYFIMFGPDICGVSSKRTHLIFNHNEENHLRTKEISCENDVFTHVYTLVLHPDNTYEVLIDQESKASGSLFDDWTILPPRTIPDPEASKPDDWVNDRMMDDPEDVKPADWDDAPAEIVDPNASMPEDWDEESDGAWEPAMIPNPEFKGVWKAKRIENPDYKGAWVHPEIPNPDFVEDSTLYAYKGIETVGFELWQVKAGTIFDSIVITDDATELDALAKAGIASRDAEKEQEKEEKEQKRKADEEERQRKKEEEAKKKEEQGDQHDDDDEWFEDQDIDFEFHEVPSTEAPKDEL